MKRILVVATLVLLMAFSAQSLLAQRSTAELRGTVKDTEGKVVPDVTVTALNTGTGIEWKATSDDRGRYVFLTLPAGNYNVKLAREGYKERVYEGIVLNIGQQISYNMEIEVGAFEQTIVITGETPLVETTKSAVGTVVSEEFIKAIPTKNRDFEDLALLAPGVNSNRGGGLGSGLTVNGMRGFSNTFILDGVSNDDAYVGGNISYISQDTIQEFDVMTHMAPAEFGQATGGIVNIATRSGTNDFHGSASLYFRNQSLKEKDFFADEKPETSRYVLGATLGGPIITDQAHFFFSYEGTDNNSSSVITAPREAGTSVANGSTNHFYFGKIDYQFNEANMFSFRVNGSMWQQANAGVGGWNLQETGYDATNNTFAAYGNWSSFLSDNMLNELRFSYSKKDWSGEPYSDVITEWHNLGNRGRILGTPYEENTSKTQIIDNFTYLLTDHTVKLGFDFARTGTWADATNWAYGAWNFSTNDEFDPNDLSTYPYLYRQSINTTTEFDIPQNSYGLFAQDQWNIGDKLTVNLGLRWDYEGFWENMVGAGTLSGEPIQPDKNNFQPRIGITWRPFENSNTTFRAGFGRFFDQIPTNEASFIYLNTVNTTGFLFLWGWSEYGTIPIYPNRPNPDDYLVPGGDTAADFLDSELQLPHLDQIVFGLSHQFTPFTAIHMDFTYNEAKDLWLLTNGNPRDPVTGQRPIDYDADMYAQASIGQSEYKGLMTRLEHRFAKGVVNLAYTLASSYDNMAGDPNSSPVFDAFDPMNDWGPGVNDIRHRLVISGFVVLPFDFTLSGQLSYNSAPPYTARAADDVNGDGIFWDIAPGHSRGDMRGDDYYSLDLRFGKMFVIDRYRFEAFLEGFNLTNTVNYTSFTSRYDYSNFGEPAGAAAMREMQIGLRFEF
ncbi:MAG TPA: TonB-dependent receptor [Acidobacteriota bacterium]|nr:TonB-dependent receptor [Acidobacteriota bacterium]